MIIIKKMEDKIMKKLTVLIFVALSIILYAEKYAVIYTELPEMENLRQPHMKYDLRQMEKAWKTTFLLWEDLTQEKGYKIENVPVIYCNGYDFYEYPEGDYLNVRFRPQHYGVNYVTKRNVPATRNGLDSVIETLSTKMTKQEELLIFEYDIEKNEFIKTKYKPEGEK